MFFIFPPAHFMTIINSKCSNIFSHLSSTFYKMLQHFWDQHFLINIFWLLPIFFRNVTTFLRNVGFVNYFLVNILQKMLQHFLECPTSITVSASGSAPAGVRGHDGRRAGRGHLGPGPGELEPREPHQPWRLDRSWLCA
jgi:hypothetical protein